MYTSKERERQIRVKQEKLRKQKIINERICSVNKVDTYIKLRDNEDAIDRNVDLRERLSPQRAR